VHHFLNAGRRFPYFFLDDGSVFRKSQRNDLRLGDNSYYDDFGLQYVTFSKDGRLRYSFIWDHLSVVAIYFSKLIVSNDKSIQHLCGQASAEEMNEPKIVVIRSGRDM
jgi:hypothetical protein